MHPEGGTQGSKDSIDAVVGALWNANLHSDEYAYEYGEDLELFMQYTGAKEAAYTKEDFVNDLNASMGATLYNKNVSSPYTDLDIIIV